ncbi:unnamed protein product [Musa textilis]
MDVVPGLCSGRSVEPSRIPRAECYPSFPSHHLEGG